MILLSPLVYRSVVMPLILCRAPNPLGQLRSRAEALLRDWLYIDLTGTGSMECI